MMVAKLAFVIQLRQAEHQALACGQIAKHLGEQILNQLERGDRLAELQSLLGVFEGCLECAHLDAGRRPTHHVSRHPQHACGIAERIATLQAVRFGHPYILHRDLAVLDHLERDLVLDFLDAETGCRLVLDDESLDLVVAEVARPDDGDVAPWCVADPPLLSIKNPGIAFTLGRRGQTAARSRTDQRLGEAEAADLFQACHRRQPFLLLLLGAVEIDRSHRQTTVDAEERAERRIGARQLHRDEAEQFLAASGAAIAFKAEPAEAEFLERWQQFERKRVIGPVFVDDRLDFGLHVSPHLMDDRSLLGREKVDQLIEVAVGYRHRLRCGDLACCGCSGHLRLLWLRLESRKIEGRVGCVIDLAGGTWSQATGSVDFVWLDLATLLRSSIRPSRTSSRSASSCSMVRDPTSAWTLSMSFFCTSGVSTGEPRVFHQAVIGPVNCWKKCSMPPGPPPRWLSIRLPMTPQRRPGPQHRAVSTSAALTTPSETR